MDALPAGTPVEPKCDLAFEEVLKARERIRPHLPHTPTVHSPALDEALGCEAYVKCESLQPIGAFKVRGGVNLMLSVSEERRRSGVVTASTGNHGQSIAYAARLVGSRAVIHAPAGANPLKVESMRRLGAEVVLQGRDFGEAKLIAEENARRRGMPFISSGDEPLLIAGVATAYLELLEDAPDLDLILVPVGGGSGASGACLARDGLGARARIIGVQALGAPAVAESWRSRRIVRHEATDTFADGLATREPYLMPLGIILAGLADFLLVGEEDMKAAIRLLARTLHVIAEGAGAAATAAALGRPELVSARRVGLMLSGGNLPLEQLQEILAATC